MTIYGEPKGKGVSTKHIGQHRWTPKHVKDESKSDADKRKDNGK